MPLFLSYFHTALLWNITSLIGTKGGEKKRTWNKAVGYKSSTSRRKVNFEKSVPCYSD